MNQTTIADRIRARLGDLKKSASAVALEAGLGRSAVLDILKGKASHPRLDTLRKLTGPLQCTLAYLTGTADQPDGGAERDPLTDAEPSAPVTALEAGVYRESPAPSSGDDSQMLYRDRRISSMRVQFYEVGDNTMVGAGIMPGDLVTVTADDLDVEIPLEDGIIVVCSRTLPGSKATELSMRLVKIAGDQVHLALVPSTGESQPIILPTDISMDPDEHNQLANFHSTTVPGVVVVIHGVATRVTRSLPVPQAWA